MRISVWSSCVCSSELRMHALDVDAALAAAQRLKFMRLDPSLDIQVGAAENLNRPTLALLSAFLMSLQTGSSRGVLQWPFGQRDASVLHPQRGSASGRERVCQYV